MRICTEELDTRRLCDRAEAGMGDRGVVSEKSRRSRLFGDLQVCRLSRLVGRSCSMRRDEMLWPDKRRLAAAAAAAGGPWH